MLLFLANFSYNIFRFIRHTFVNYLCIALIVKFSECNSIQSLKPIINCLFCLQYRSCHVFDQSILPNSLDKWPRTEKITHDAMRDVTKSKLETTDASICTLLLNLLYDPNINRPPHEIPNEKNICSAAFRHTTKSNSLSHFGTNR